VCQQVLEEAAVDLGRALEAFSSGRKGERAGKKPRFPKFKRKAATRQAFRLRNKGSGKAAAIRVGEGEQARVVRLPKLGCVRVRESTRRLRRMLRKDRAKILFATVSTREGGRWRVTLNVQASPLHLERCRTRGEATSPVGIDRGLRTRRCARCGTVGEALSLSERIFRCGSCSHEADRDTNAAACLAQYPRVTASGAWPHVAAKHAETQNVCGEESAGARVVWSVRETVLYEAERTSVRRPRRAVLFETVNTL